jgi:hypothetical protein
VEMPEKSGLLEGEIAKTLARFGFYLNKKMINFFYYS